MLWSNYGAYITHALHWLVSFVVFVTNLRPAGADCNGRIDELQAETFKQMITSPNYPDVYGTYLVCRWTVSTERSYEVIRFQIVDLAITASTNCADDYVEVKDGVSSWSPVLRRYCGSNVNAATPLTSSSRTVSITFATDGKHSDRGFKLAFWSVPKDEVMFTKPVWTASNYIALGVFFAIICFIAISMITIAILRQLHSAKVKVRKREPVPSMAERRRLQKKEALEVNGMPRDPSYDSVNTDCNTTRTSIGESTTNLASLL